MTGALVNERVAGGKVREASYQGPAGPGTEEDSMTPSDGT